MGKQLAEKERYLEDMHRRLREVRRAFGYESDQAGYAQLLGLRLTTYNSYETRSWPPLHVVRAICELTGISADFMLGVRRSPTKPAGGNDGMKNLTDPQYSSS